MSKQRIEYIDAMRGFTMILVVYSHICNYCLGDRLMAFNDVMFLFRLPCFFFISGWLFNVESGITHPRQLVKHKFMVQIIPTFIFLLLLAGPSLFISRFGATKGGYWFTFALFEFFCLYLLTDRLFRRFRQADGLMCLAALLISVAAFAYDIYYNRYFSHMGWLTKGMGFLSFMTWRYYLFFFIGTMVKRHFEAFIRWTSRSFVILPTLIGFCLIALTCHSSLVTYQSSLFSEYFIFAIGGVLGMTLVFTFFRHFERWFQKDKWLGRGLQYIGTRTLDIYLLHYFFLPRFLMPYGEQLRAYDCQLLECLVALVLALLIVGICLLVSYVIRLSPFLGHYLFGVK